MKRLDVALVELNLAPSRTKAQQMIEAGEVEVGGVAVLQASRMVDPSDVRVRADSQTLKYVSRGGLKLEGALRRLQIQPSEWMCLDIGLSTGGFADCLLQMGASKVVGVDVGKGQLHDRLARDPRVISYDKINARELPSEIVPVSLDLCVVDVSFISLTQIILRLKEVLPAKCKLLALVKPQFEVGASGLDKNGIVRDPNLFIDVQTKIATALEKNGFSVHDYFPCELKGQDGNQEFFVFATRN